MTKTRSTNIVTMDGNEDTIFNTVGLTDTYFEGKIMAKQLASGDTLRIRVYNRNDGVSYYPFDSDVNDYCGSNNGTITYNSNLKRLYKFEGNVNDSTTNANGTVATGTAIYLSGKEGSCFSFNGSTAITASDASLPTTTSPVSVSFWIYLLSLAATQTIFQYGTGAGTTFSIGLNTSGNIIHYNGTTTTTISTTALSIATWYYVTITYDGTNAIVYLNAVSDKTTAITCNTSLGGTSGLTIGYNGSTQNLTGYIDELRVYSGTVLSQDQVSALYMVGKYGQSHTFDGGEYISLGNSATLNFERTNSFSYSYLFKGTSVSTLPSVLDHYNGTSGIVNAINTSGQPQIYLINNFGGGNYLQAHVSTVINDGNWHHVVWTYSGNSNTSGLSCYVDNSSISVISDVNGLSASIQNNNNWLIGIQQGSTAKLTGQLDDLRIYNRALSASDVTDLYNNPAPMKSVLYDKSYSGPLSPTTCIYVPYITSNQYTLTAQQTTTSNYYKTINGELYSVT